MESEILSKIFFLKDNFWIFIITLTILFKCIYVEKITNYNCLNIKDYSEESAKIRITENSDIKQEWRMD